VGYVLKMFPRFSETFILNEILELERQGVEVFVFSMKPPTESLRQPKVARVRAPVQVIPPLARWRVHARCHVEAFLRWPGRYLRTLVFARKRRSRAGWEKFLAAPYVAVQARRLGLEHLHAHFASGPARQVKFASLISGIPYSFTAHAKDLFWAGHAHGENNKLKKRVRFASFVVAISEHNRRFIQSLNFKVPKGRVVTIYNGLPLEEWTFLRPEGRPVAAARAPSPVILAVGRFVEKKGFHILLEACRILRERGVAFRCVLAGDGPLREALEAQRRRLGLADVVEMPGAIPQDRLLELYARAHVLAQPCVVARDGDVDGIPTVILEALAVGLPVVTTPVSGIPEAVQEGRTGLLVPPGDAEGLAHALARVLEDGELAGRLAREGRRLVEARFSLERNVSLLRRMMESAARGTPRPRRRDLYPGEESGIGEGEVTHEAQVRG
jgi:glycosyltransferase involved in cell wall biosynthesis